MDLRKIGKLIAKLRNDKGLTQQDLADLVGVGFRTVSKWERGINLPDIGNINELSKIFGVTNDEILKGELKEETVEEEPIEKEINDKETPTKKNTVKIKVIISIITALILTLITTIIFPHNEEYVYKIKSANEQEYYIQGELILKDNNIKINLNKIKFKDDNFSAIKINEYEYRIFINDELIFGFGDTFKENKKNKPISIQDFTRNLKINYNSKTTLTNEQLNDNSLLIKLVMWDTNSIEINKELKIKLINDKK